MELFTRQKLAENVSEHWNRTYAGSQWSHKRDIGDKLSSAPVLNPDIVREIIGNDSWTETRCNECDAKNIPVVQLGEEPDYESSTAYVCRECLEKAISLINRD